MANKVLLSDSGIRHLEARGTGDSFLEQRPNLSREICVYLETREICRVISSSNTLKKQGDAPRLWQMVSPTLALPDSFWPKRSKNEVRQNLAMLKRVTQTFAFCCRKDGAPGPDGETLRQKMIKFAKIENPNFDERMSLENPRGCFTSYTRPVVNAIRENSPAPCETFHNMLLCDVASAAQMLEMFYACGERGNEKTLNYISGLPLYCSKLKDNTPPQFAGVFVRDFCIKNLSYIDKHNSCAVGLLARITDAIFSMDALELLLKYGETPETFASLLDEYNVRPQKRLGEIIGLLIEKKAIPSDFALRRFLWNGPLEFVKVLIEKTNIEVGLYDLSHFLYMLRRPATSDAFAKASALPLTVGYICSVLDLMKKKQPEVRDLHLVDSRFCDNFGIVAWFCGSPILLDKLIEVGIKPVNEDSPSNTLRRALAWKAPYRLIALLHKYGATLPPQSIKDLIHEKYSDQPLVQEQLFKLLAS